MKKIFFLVVILTLSLLCRAQERKYSTFYYQRATLFEELPVTSSDIIFLGNSITNGAEWAELFKNKHVKNRGISGDICIFSGCEYKFSAAKLRNRAYSTKNI